MTRVESSIEIATPADRVAAFFVPQRMPYWFGSDMDAEFEMQGGEADFCVGQKVRITGRVLRKEVRLTAVVTRYLDGRMLEWQFRDEYGIRGLQRWEVSSTLRGTLVRTTDEFELPSRSRLARLAERFWMRPSVLRRARAHLLKLKKLAERS